MQSLNFVVLFILISVLVMQYTVVSASKKGDSRGAKIPKMGKSAKACKKKSFGRVDTGHVDLLDDVNIGKLSATVACSVDVPLTTLSEGFSGVRSSFRAKMRDLGEIDVEFSLFYDYQYYDGNYLCAPVVGGCSTTLQKDKNTDVCYNGPTTNELDGPVEFDSVASVTVVDTGEVYTGTVTGGSNCEVPKDAQATLLNAEAQIRGLGRLVVNSYNVGFGPQFISVELHK